MSLSTTINVTIKIKEDAEERNVTMWYFAFTCLKYMYKQFKQRGKFVTVTVRYYKSSTIYEKTSGGMHLTSSFVNY